MFRLGSGFSVWRSVPSLPHLSRVISPVPSLNPMRAFGLPRRKAPAKTVKIYCQKCRSLLYHYRKGGNGHLVKCFEERMVERCVVSSADTSPHVGVADAEIGDEPSFQCPQCSEVVARRRWIRGRPAHKIVQGKVYMTK